jgi:dienelactone hydrolase
MNSFICQFIDRWVIRSATARMPRSTGADPHLDQAERLLQSPDFFAEDTPPAAITFTGGKNFQFPSPVVTDSPENNIVRGRLSRCGKHWRKRPVVILLHGWNDRWGYRSRLPKLSHSFGRRGINSLMFELPYHFQRQPAQGVMRNFISEDVGRTVEATHQALAEIAAITGWLLQQGCPRVAIWGYSMGAWLAGLASCYDPRISAAVLFTPVSRVDRLIREIAFCEPIRQALKTRTIDVSRLNLAAHKPKLTRGYILLVEAEYDLFVPAETTEELWQAWGNPELWRQPQGHISILGASRIMKRASKWVGLRLKATAADGDKIDRDTILA